MTTTTFPASNILVNFTSGGTNPTFVIHKGGSYQLDFRGTLGSATLQVQQLGPDGVTYEDVGSAVAALGASTVTLPAGAYKLSMGGTGGSALYATLKPLF